LWEQLVLAICRPPRDQYEKRDLLGGTSGHFILGKCICRREDFQITNTRGRRLEVSRFVQVNANYRPQLQLPTVIYCHCNSGSRRDAEEAVYRLLPDGIAVVCLDFEGSGLSEGEYVTLGAHEVDDVQCVMEHLRSNNMASLIGLWGRSMGAVTALMCSQQDPTIAGIVCDSPFSRLKDLMLELVEEQKIPIPKPFLKIVLGLMRRSVKNRANFDIYEVSPLDKVHEAFVPVLFGHGEEDTFILKHHSEQLHERYAGEKNLIKFEGDHNSLRPPFFYTSAVIFFHNVLQIDPSGQLQANGGSNGSVFERGSFWDSEHTVMDDIPGSNAGSPEAMPLEGDSRRTYAAAGLQSPSSLLWTSGELGGGDSRESRLSWHSDGSDEADIMERVMRMSMIERQAEPPPDRSGGAEEEAFSNVSEVEHVFGAGSSLRSMLPTSENAEAMMLAQAIAASLGTSSTQLPPDSGSTVDEVRKAMDELEPLVVRALPNGGGGDSESVPTSPAGGALEPRPRFLSQMDSAQPEPSVIGSAGRRESYTLAARTPAGDTAATRADAGEEDEEQELERLRNQAAVLAWQHAA